MTDMMQEELTISELMRLEPKALLERCARTLELFPLIGKFYDPAFLADLVRHRNTKNYLLFLLAQPGDSIAMEILSDVSEDLLLLAPIGSLKAFRTKFRQTKFIDFVSARSELFWACRVFRSGKSVSFEPSVGKRKSEFKTEHGGIPVHFEVKSVLDREALRRQSDVAEDVMERLRAIEQPYVLHLIDIVDVELNECAAAVRNLKRTLAAHFKASGALPACFSVDGLVVEAHPSKGSQGYLGVSMTNGDTWGDEEIVHARRRIHSALGQLPAGGAGVVILDQTPNMWMDHEDVFEACFGTASLRVVGGRFVDYHDGTGIFQRQSHTRISAVISHTRRWAQREETVVYHNPFAQAPLPDDFLASGDVRQRRWNHAQSKFVDF